MILNAIAGFAEPRGDRLANGVANRFAIAARKSCKLNVSERSGVFGSCPRLSDRCVPTQAARLCAGEPSQIPKRSCLPEIKPFG